MSIFDSVKGTSRQAAITVTTGQIIRYVHKSPEQNFEKMVKALVFLGARFGNPKPFNDFINWLDSNPGTKEWFICLMKKDRKQVANVIKLLFGNCSLKWIDKSNKLQEKYDFTAPYSILISPTMRCNLRCKGCYAQNYARDDDLSLEIIDSIITQGKSLGTYLYTILGGEPFIRFDDIYKVASKHNDCLFQVFTNGTLITEKIAEKIGKLNNVIVVFSVNGNKEEMEYIRGPGVYEKILTSMERLNRRNLMFGMSLVLTSRNYEQMMRESFYKSWQDRGVMYAWNFLFMPVTKDADLSLMPTPEQRIRYGEFVKTYREKNPLFIMDFWSDAPAVHGCIAGGRRFIHINHKGDIEPCIFAHFATHNIKEHTLLEALKSPFFSAIRQHSPHTDNLLRPCMIIDNPQVLRDVCKRHNARPTDEGSRCLIEDSRLISHLDKYSEEVARVIDPIWKERYQDYIADMLTRKQSYPEGSDRIAYRLDRKTFMDNIKRYASHDPDYATILLKEAEEAFSKYERDHELHMKNEDEEKADGRSTELYEAHVGTVGI
ncbi:MAG: radical SAM protein [Deltaproteobacteria bacterium]|nr:radical SAM protein [Deltaproteobacteria bacterium]